MPILYLFFENMTVATSLRGNPPPLFCSSSSSAAASLLSRPLPLQLCHARFSSFALSLRGTFSSQHSPFLSSTVRCMTSGSSSAGKIEDLVKDKNAQNPVVVYSKTWCPYCSRVKGLFSELGVRPLIVELDELADEAQVQGALQKLTGQSTVPNVFIGGKHIGGCDDTVALHQSGRLIPLLKEAGAKLS